VRERRQPGSENQAEPSAKSARLGAYRFLMR
jgi:hypothetical protein